MSQEVQYTLARHQNRRPAGHIRSRRMMLISLAFLLYIPAVILSINALISEDHSWGLGVAQTGSQPPTWQITGLIAEDWRQTITISSLATSWSEQTIRYQAARMRLTTRPRLRFVDSPGPLSGRLLALWRTCSLSVGSCWEPSLFWLASWSSLMLPTGFWQLVFFCSGTP